ncbi:MAG: hypothetical protein ACU4EQ_13375 [Candidatus Nitrosoglobus sp.]
MRERLGNVLLQLRSIIVFIQHIHQRDGDTGRAENVRVHLKYLLRVDFLLETGLLKGYSNSNHKTDNNGDLSRMENILKTLSLAALLSVNSAFAITPENGWWWNPQESGMGFNIETQNGTVFIATFVYDDSGNPIWYSGSAQIDTNSTVAINLQISRNGPCPTCPYQAPTTSDAGMPITLQFTSRDEGSVSWQGSTTPTPIQRFNFNYGTGLQMLVGDWVLMTEMPTASGQYEGFRITFDSVQGDQAFGEITGEPGTTVAVSNTNQDPEHPYTAQITYPALTTPNETMQITGLVFNFSGLNKIAGTATLEPLAQPSGTTSPPIISTAPFEAYRIVK